MSDVIPDYPMTRTCPFDPPAEQTENGPVSKVRIETGATAWLVTGYDEQREALVDPRLSSDFRKPGYPARVLARRTRSFISMDNPEHQQQRRMLIKHFTVKRIASMRPAIEGLVDTLLEQMLAKQGHADLVADFALPLPSLVICDLLGVPYADHDFFQRCSSVQLTLSAPIAEREAARDDLADYLRDLVDKAAENPGDDLIGDLVVNQVRPGHLTTAEVADMCSLLLIAGHETTANMIALGTLTLLRHPNQLAELRASDDPALMTSAVEELLRYLTIVHQGLRRVATDDIEIAGTTIAAGEGVIISADAGNRAEGAFEGDPDTLDIHRAARHHVAFGFGVHQCLGQALARLELEIAYRALITRVPGLDVAAELDDIDFKDDMFVYGVRSLPITFDTSTVEAS
ncbi:cytochrome [Williamsia sp. Leaf354]|uniref:cytochrome P450 n=1 Tax=Williamsia sp. Leaf354 TaxID=1736349 RepID=UPI0006F52B8C|nr:cytochrome P450 [Williamsia sp. Leaf354]KQS00672.1 cytochrome [Williamsia sp. Leaf354]